MTMPPRIDAHSATTRHVQPEWCEPLLQCDLAFVSELGCLDAPTCIPAGSVRRMHHNPDALMPSFWQRPL